MIITSTYDLRLVALSLLIAVLALYTAQDLAGRIALAQGLAQTRWLVSGAIVMGIGIWSRLLLVFKLQNQTNWNWQKLLSAFVMGGAISGMHYTAMAAVHFTLTEGFRASPEHT